MIYAVFTAILLPACIALLFAVIKNARVKVSQIMTDENFTVMIPRAVISVGVMCDFMALAFLLGFTFFSDERPHFLFYVFMALIVWLGMYLIVKTLAFKVIVKKDKITVFPTWGKSYVFTFDDIASAVRQVKNNQVNSERIVVKTTSGKRLIVESAEIAYDRFRKNVQSKVSRERIKGF